MAPSWIAGEACPTLGCRRERPSQILLWAFAEHTLVWWRAFPPTGNFFRLRRLCDSSDLHPMSSHQPFFQFQIYRIFHPDLFIGKTGGGHLGNDTGVLHWIQFSLDNRLLGRSYHGVVLSSLSISPEPAHPVLTSDLCLSSRYSVVM